MADSCWLWIGCFSYTARLPIMSNHYLMWCTKEVILDAGAAGLTAALTSTIEGKHTLLIEKSDQIGGTVF